MVVKKSGPGTVVAGDIQTVGDIVVLNPDLVLCTLDEGAEIRMEFTVATGKGYVPAERNRPRTRRSGSSRSTACTRRAARSPTRSRTPARARSSTTTS
jgi:DNA-directed RNA polymerase alpha subunit